MTFISTSKWISAQSRFKDDNELWFRYDELDTSPITWHIDPTAGVKDGDENYAAINNYVVMPEPWQSAVNGIY